MDRILVPTVYVHCCIPIHIDGTCLDCCDFERLFSLLHDLSFVRHGYQP